MDDSHNADSGPYDAGQKGGAIQTRQDTAVGWKRNSRKVHVEPIPDVDLDELRADIRGKQCVTMSVKHMEIIVTIPYDRELTPVMRRLAGDRDDKNRWHFHISAHQALRPYLNRLEELYQADWRDQVVCSGRLKLGDVKLWVKDDAISDYEIGDLIFHKGGEWVVTHIARPVFFKDNGLKYPVFIRQHEEWPLNMPEHREFDS